MSGPANRLAGLRTPLLLLLTTPVAPLLHYVVGARPLWVFAASALAIAVLADWVRRATEQIAERIGPAIGGLINVSFGSLAELILALFMLAEGKLDVVRAQITGSIIATALLGLGIAIVVGSIGRDALRFRRDRAGLLSTMLVLVVIALLLPAVFDLAGHLAEDQDRLAITEEELSLGVAAVLLVLYAANLVYTLVTHRDIFAADEPREAHGAWPLWTALAVLAAVTAAVALQAELAAGALEETAASLSLSPVFLGIVVLAVVGTSSDLFAAAWFARDAKMGLVLNICVGSAIQVALVLAPLLVVLSWLMGHPLSLVFTNPLDLFAIAGTAFIVKAIAEDGEATWFEGVLLIGIYVLLGLAFFFSAPVG